MRQIVSTGLVYLIMWRVGTFAKRGKDTPNAGKYISLPRCIYIKTDIYKVSRMQKVAVQKSLFIALCITLEKFDLMHLCTANSRLDYTWYSSHRHSYYGKLKSENSRSSSFLTKGIGAEHQIDQKSTYTNNKQLNNYYCGKIKS